VNSKHTAPVLARWFLQLGRIRQFRLAAQLIERWEEQQEEAGARATRGGPEGSAS